MGSRTIHSNEDHPKSRNLRQKKRRVENCDFPSRRGCTEKTRNCRLSPPPPRQPTAPLHTPLLPSSSPWARRPARCCSGGRATTTPARTPCPSHREPCG